MGFDYKEQKPLESSSDTLEQLKVSEQQAWDKLDDLLHNLSKNDVSESRDVFREFSPVTLMDGLTLERFRREDTETVPLEDEKISPLDYTSESTVSSEGLLHPGQIEIEKLTDQARKNISGDIEHDIPLWHYQLEDKSCAVACQDFILRSMGKNEISEQQLIDEGRKLGIYRDEGTYLHEIGLLAELHGMEREVLQDCTLEQIEQIHASGGKVIALVSRMKMAYPKLFGWFRSDHAVEVIGIDRNDPEDVRVILNDPGRKDGQGLSVPEKVFEKAWKTSKKCLIALYEKEEVK